jgi:hypothetical protein
MNIRHIIYAIIAVLLSTACSHENKSHLPIVRLDKIVADFPNMSDEQRRELAEIYHTHLATYVYIMGMPMPTLEYAIDSLSRTPAYKVFYPDVEERLPSLDSLETVLGGVRDRMTAMFPDTGTFGYYGVISPFQQHIMISDTIVMIALNHYLGSDYPGYESMDAYRRVVKTPQHLPYDLAEAIISMRRPYVPEKDATVLSKMLYQGALTNSVLNVIGDDASLAEMLGWTDEQLALVEKNEGEIWKHLVRSGLLQSVDALDADRLLSPAPATNIVSSDLPGRLGRYIGYKIVRAYLENNESISESAVMDRTFYNNPQSIIRANYNPK